MINDEIYNTYFYNLIKGNKNECLETIKSLIDKNISIETLYTHLFMRSLYQVGEYWESNKISVATEHMATAITENLMIRLQPQLFNTNRKGKKAVIACIANEYHQVGAKMAADIFEMNGWDSYFIGANTPTEELVRFIEYHQPDLVGFSLSLFFNLPELKKTLTRICVRLPDTPVLVGGQAFRWGGTDIINEFSQTVYLPGIESLDEFIKQTEQQ